MQLAAAGSSVVQTHLAHIIGAVAFIVGGIGAAAVADMRDRRRTGKRRTTTVARKRPTALLAVAAAGSIGAATVHYNVMPEHFGEAFIYGLFFACLATSQVVWGLAVLLRPRRTLLIAGVAANVAVVALWLFTRLVEVPIGPGAGETEEFSALDVIASGFEVAVIVAGFLALRQMWRSAVNVAAELSAPDDPLRSPVADTSRVPVSG